MKKKISMILLMACVCLVSVVHSKEKQWWEKWDRFPKEDKAPRIMPNEVKKLMMAGEKMVFVYTGFDVEKVVCGSLYIPYLLVPPEHDGSRINLKPVPKDWWVMCYCP